MQVYGPLDVSCLVRLAVGALIFSISGSNGTIAPAQAAGGEAVVAAGDARANIRQRVELRHDGIVQPDGVGLRLPAHVHVCDPEALESDPGCVLLIYEIE